jgi:hypothetical protein
MKHHFYPQFALSRWAGDDNLLQPFEWNPSIPKGPVVPCKRTATKSACSQVDLYALKGVSLKNRYILETDFFTRQIDTPAAGVLTIIERESVNALDDEQRLAWAKFLISLPARTPEAIDELGVRGYISKLNENPEEYEALRGGGDLKTLAEWAEKHNPHVIRDWVLKMLTEMVCETDAVPRVVAMEWWTRRFGDRELLLADRPLLSSTGQEGVPCGINADDPRHVIALPIGPNTVFFASHDKRIRSRLRSESRSAIAMRLNNETLHAAKKYVFATDLGMFDFVKRKWPDLHRL